MFGMVSNLIKLILSIFIGKRKNDKIERDTNFAKALKKGDEKKVARLWEKRKRY